MQIYGFYWNTTIQNLYYTIYGRIWVIFENVLTVKINEVYTTQSDLIKYLYLANLYNVLFYFSNKGSKNLDITFL